MQRYRIVVEYDGQPFVGWQRQAEGRSVQGEIEAALMRLTGETAVLRGAGRTDAGVHALGQVAHFDLAKDVETDTIRDGLNAHLRGLPIAVLAASAVGADFDARFSATGRHYAYRILNRRSPPALDAGRVWQVARPIDADAMQRGAAALVGHHDFTTFRAAECQAKSPVKTLDRLEVSRQGDEVRVEASARSFLHSQVRSMVGTLAKVGIGAWPVGQVATALAARDRSACGPLAPPQGLYLVAVDYGTKPATEEAEDDAA
jgi:tRNA pseudouridine38-40 synthase